MSHHQHKIVSGTMRVCDLLSAQQIQAGTYIDVNLANVEASLVVKPYEYVVSLATPGHTEHVKGTKRSCWLQFDDVEYTTHHTWLPPMMQHVYILHAFAQDFLKAMGPADRILFHCQAGMSRSTASALLFLLEDGYSVDKALDYLYTIRPVATPNLLLAKHIDTHLHLEGELVRKLGKRRAAGRVNEDDILRTVFKEFGS